MSDDAMLDQLPDGVVVIGPDRAVVQMNGAAERLTGWRRDEALGRFYGEVLRLRHAAGFLVHERMDPFSVAPRLATGSPEREYMLSRRDGTERWVAVRTAYEWEDGLLRQIVATIRDIGRRHRLERSAYDLIATLAHDLRSPLTSVKGFTSTLRRNWERFNDKQKQDMLETIDWDADRMNRLLKDLLDFSRLEAGRLELKRQLIDLPALASQVVDRIAKVNGSAHHIETDFPSAFPSVSADPGKVEQVLVNLVENAVKHGDPGLIRVSGEADDASVTVRVADSGPGIDPHHVPYVFTKFYRRGTGQRHAGTGLGLYICKGIIEAHGGQISIEHTAPSGTVFTFTLPLEED
ncbi:MAG: sensor histidine kinase [Actinomycetota bacterium]